MSKKPRPSIKDQLARIAAQSTNNVSTSERDDVSTLQRDHVKALPRDEEPFSTAPRGNVARDHVAQESPGPEGYKRRVRYEKPHASIYAHPKVFKALREIATATDCKPHDLYIEGLRLVLRQHGRDFDMLNRGE